MCGAVHVLRYLTIATGKHKRNNSCKESTNNNSNNRISVVRGAECCGSSAQLYVLCFHTVAALGSRRTTPSAHLRLQPQRITSAAPPTTTRQQQHEINCNSNATTVVVLYTFARPFLCGATKAQGAGLVRGAVLPTKQRATRLVITRAQNFRPIDGRSHNGNGNGSRGT